MFFPVFFVVFRCHRLFSCSHSPVFEHFGEALFGSFRQSILPRIVSFRACLTYLAILHSTVVTEFSNSLPRSEWMVCGHRSHIQRLKIALSMFSADFISTGFAPGHSDMWSSTTTKCLFPFLVLPISGTLTPITSKGFVAVNGLGGGVLMSLLFSRGQFLHPLHHFEMSFCIPSQPTAL